MLRYLTLEVYIKHVGKVITSSNLLLIEPGSSLDFGKQSAW